MAAVNLIGSYNYGLVALSVLIAIFASYTALDLAGRVTAASGWSRALWLLGGASAMGTGIWSMHYIGMLAFVLPIPVAYHWPTVLLSLFAAILASVVALRVVSRQKMGAFRALAGSVLMGAGISSMHYIGMAAMRLSAACRFDSFLVVLSIVFAVLISLVALWITFHFRNQKNGIGWKKLAGAVVMGAAIPVMHYTGMAAVTFRPSSMAADLSHAVSISTLSIAGIATVTFMVLGLALLMSRMDRQFAARALERQEGKLRRSEAYLSEAQRLSHTGSFGWRVSSGEIIWSEETFRIFQYDRTTQPTVELILQRVHPEDIHLVRQTIDRATQEGKDFEHEHRLVMPDGAIKHVHVVAHAEKDESGEVEFIGAVMDITERKRAEEDLLRTEALAEQRLRLLVDTTPTMINTHGPDGYLDYANKGWLDYLGFSLETALERADVMKMSVPSQADMFDGKWQPIIHPEDLPGFTDQWKEMLASGKAGEREARVRRFDGVYRWHLFRAVPLRDETGGAVKWYGSAFDIEDQKRAEEALRQSENYLAEAQRLAHTGSWVWSVPGRDSLLLSEEWYRIYGFDPEKGVPSWEERLQRIHPEDRIRRKREIGRAAAEKAEFEMEYRILFPDGRIKYIHTVGHPVLNAAGDLVRFVGSSTDITDGKQAEMLLAGEKRLLEMIAKGDSHTAVLNALCRLVEELAHGSLSSILLLDPNTKCLRHGAAPSLPRAYTSAVDGSAIGPCAGSCGTAAYRAESVIVSDIAADPLWADYRDLALPYGLRACWSTPILDSERKVLGTFATYYREPRSPTPHEHHVIERITHLASIAIGGEQAEEALRQARADLARVSRVTTMGELTASLAHEVNQPIAAALTDANTCLRWLARERPDTEEARLAASRVVKGATRAAEIVNRIRVLFKKGTSQRELVDVNDLIREMIALLNSEATRYSISIRTELATDLPHVVADRVQLQQVLMNLMLNGIEAIREAGCSGELAIKSELSDNGQPLISVSDTGVGLPQQTNQIFNAFFTTKLHGTGMGLSISRSIVESHGGRLWATANSPRGACFHVALPSKLEARQ